MVGESGQLDQTPVLRENTRQRFEVHAIGHVRQAEKEEQGDKEEERGGSRKGNEGKQKRERRKAKEGRK